jgi:hypothetical protein
MNKVNIIGTRETNYRKEEMEINKNREWRMERKEEVWNQDNDKPSCVSAELTCSSINIHAEHQYKLCLS